MTLELGEFVLVTLIERQGNRWSANFDEGLPGWKVFAKGEDDAEWAAGDLRQLRIYGMDTKRREALVSDLEFGFRDISDRMRPRYRKTAETLLDWLSNKEQSVPNDIESLLSEAKGIANRCVKKDQWDWFDVYVGLGRPALTDLRQVVRLLSEIRRTIVDGHALPSNLLDQLQKFDFLEMMRRLCSHLETSYTGLVPDQVYDSHRKPVSRITVKSRPNNGQSKVVHVVDKSKLDEANRLHEHTLQVLRRSLREIGCFPEYNLFIDLFARLISGPAVFEVKSITAENELDQTRKAVAQLYEYRWRHNYPEASLWLVYSHCPVTDWLLPYLIEDRGIRVLWVEDGQLAGPSATDLARNFTRPD